MSLALIEILSPVAAIPFRERSAIATPTRSPDRGVPERYRTVACDALVVGGGLAGVATAYEALLAGRTVCLTEITDWLGGQISAQGTSALDERPTQQARQFYSRGYLELRRRLQERQRDPNPGDCWVSETCFSPRVGDAVAREMLREAARRGRGRLEWFPSTVVKELDRSGSQIRSVTAIEHRPAPGAPALNTDPLSQTIEDWYRYENSDRFQKQIIRFVPAQRERNRTHPADWYVVDATETGEIIGLADVPYRLGIDARSYLEPSSSSASNDPYCPQGYTYTFAMEATAERQRHEMPSFYLRYHNYYSYELSRFDFDAVFTYRRIFAATPRRNRPTNRRSYQDYTVHPGDISMQNWTWGNDYRPGTNRDNLIYSREQLRSSGQLNPGGWMGGLRTASLRSAEELARGYFYWLAMGTTDSQLGPGVKVPQPNIRYLSGLDSPMGTAHGLSKYPYMREGRRIIGRPSLGQPQGFSVWEVDISRRDYSDPYYQTTLSPETYRRLRATLAGLNAASVIGGQVSPENAMRRTRSTIFPDAVGIGHYAIDFHPCMQESPPEKAGNREREGERRGAGQAYPFQIPLRSMIPQQVDNLLVAGKSIATSHIAAAAYRVHSFEWSSGAAVGNAIDFALDQGVLPYQLVDQLPQREPLLEQFQQRLNQQNNPTAFPNTSIFNENWEDWR
ncbi:FAD-dependent oxidoreductase [Microcoleus sp. FACHB-1515]|nr:FAD-dependent oxidoreductase [Microcoleus sp. FACHB-1515]